MLSPLAPHTPHEGGEKIRVDLTRPVSALGIVPYPEARLLQNHLVAMRGRGEIPNHLLLCEHPPTVTLGRRAQAAHINRDDPYWREHGIEIVEVDRGGSATFHGPGQIVIYPVVSLREMGLGVRWFVHQGLEKIASVLPLSRRRVKALLDPAGVWVESGGEWEKLAAVGLRIVNGVTNHGFSLNISNNLAVYQRFTPCGLNNLRVSSLERVLGRECSREEFVESLCESFWPFVSGSEERSREKRGIQSAG